MSRFLEPLRSRWLAVAIVAGLFVASGTPDALTAVQGYRQTTAPLQLVVTAIAGRAKCPKGYHIVGGGFVLTSGNSTNLTVDAPAKNGWEVGFSDGNETGTVYATCVTTS